MTEQTRNSTRCPVALITGASRRIGAAITRRLHADGYRVVIHAHQSVAEAKALASELNQQRADSAQVLRADLHDPAAATALFDGCADWGPIELLVNNASRFYPTPLAQLDQDKWEELRRSNLDAPLFLAQCLATQEALKSAQIINLLDAMLPRGLAGYSAYAAAKAGLADLTRSLARELAPRIRVNAVAPGAILWPEPEPGEAEKQQVLNSIPLGRLGSADDIADAVSFLSRAPYVTGQILAVDGGRGL